jgi:predicted Zn-dependent protease
MWEKTISTLEGRGDLLDWSLRQVESNETQRYVLQYGSEAVRRVRDEHVVVDVLKAVDGEDGKEGCGSGSATLLPGDPIEAALGEASLIAGLVNNPLYRMSRPADIPDVPLRDTNLVDNPEIALMEMESRLKLALGEYPGVWLSAAEFFIEERVTRMVNSRGFEAAQAESILYLEWVLMTDRGGDRSESFFSTRRRRLADLDLEEEVARQAQFALDKAAAGPATDYGGPVVLRREMIGTFLNTLSLKYLSSAEFTHNGETPWKIGEKIHKSQVKGDPLTMWANRLLPYGVESSCFDSEGIPAQRLLLIEDNQLSAITADQQYASYLSMTPTGVFGNLEVAPGHSHAAEITSIPHVEIIAVSWHLPDLFTGDFSTEIRLGYFVEGGKRRPFKGGMLVGNAFEALSNVRWSSETGFYGDYQGPEAARFDGLKIAG